MAGLILTGKTLESSFDEEKHVYTDESGRKLPSVTTLLKPLTDAVYGPIDKDVLRRAAEFGTAVHACTEFFDTDCLDEDSVEPEWQASLDAYKRFKADLKPEIVKVEWRVACEKYAGIIDRIALIDGEAWVIDLKTTSQIHDHVGLQLAAYEALARLHLGRKTPLRRAALQLRDDGSYRFIEFKDDSDYACFNALLNIHNWRKNHGY